MPAAAVKAGMETDLEKMLIRFFYATRYNPKKQLDLVITPGLGFTSGGLRLGRGKGYYDRFFEKCQKDLPRFPYTIGLSFKEQILQDVPTEAHDFRLDLIISPEQN